MVMTCIRSAPFYSSGKFCRIVEAILPLKNTLLPDLGNGRLFSGRNSVCTRVARMMH